MSYEYATRLLDIDRNPIAYAADQVSVSTTRRINQATEITVTVPRPRDPNLTTGAFIQRVRVHKSGTEEVVGTARVSSRNVTSDRVTYGARFDAALLENNITPANYGAALSDLLLEDLVRAVVDGWRTLRADLTAPVDSSNADLSTEPGRVMLAKQTNGRYHASGHVVLRFDREDVDEWTAWDRIRWESDFFDSVSTTMQWRHGDTLGSLSAWSDPVQGADPSGTGVSIQGTPSRFVEVRINLATSDTSTPQDTPDGVPPTVWGFTPRVFGVELIARTQGQITVGTLNIAPHVFARNVTADRTNALRILVDQFETTGHEFTVTNGVFNAARKVGSDRTNDFVLRNGSNTTITSLRDEDSTLVNRLHAYGSGSGLQQPYVFREDTTSVAQYGPYESTESFDESTLIGLTAAADAFLAEHAHPAPQFQLTGRDEHAINLGDTIRVADPTTGVVTTTRVTELTEVDDARGRTITAHLGSPPIGLIDSILKQVTAQDAELELLPPLVQVRKTAPGFAVEVTHAPRSRGVGFRVHFSTVSGFTPTVQTQRGEGNQTLFTFPRAAPGVLHFVRVAAVDRAGNTSAFTEEQPIRAGHVETAQLGPGAVREDNIGTGAVTNRTMHTNALGSGSIVDTSGVRYQQGSTDRVVLGDIAGRPGVPSGVTQGLWGALGTGVFIQGAPRLIAGGVLHANLGIGTTPATGVPVEYAWPDHQVFSSLTVPAGREVIAIINFTRLRFTSGLPPQPLQDVSLAGFNCALAGTQGALTKRNRLTPGTWSNVRIERSLWRLNSGSANRPTSAQANITYLLIEVDITTEEN